jgi:hypothetical protein
MTTTNSASRKRKPKPPKVTYIHVPHNSFVPCPGMTAVVVPPAKPVKK